MHFSLQGKVYQFDRIIKPSANQELVYDIVAKDIVKGEAPLRPKIVTKGTGVKGALKNTSQSETFDLQKIMKLLELPP